ncbi:hypothetical protein EA462_03230 [Natrarchaeobius halalkaliphilus]|uniref:Uncharacterized protein n=1 Tax=Natrarchaeobius halalkaliphilus TaxID=1679091 RepID=A0A3N6MA74_9EURY|nr:hypothetical protein [Natrarchaeobius halalkaliphilus]RQG93220.1 hypothetical protein EA462_03230 [Natrarchaeobius halalkaliphilus]
MRRRTVVVGTAAVVALSGCLFDDRDDSAEPPELHGFGTIEIVVDDSAIDLSEDRFQAEHADDYSMDFHLHEDTDFWYMEGDEPVTFAAGIDVLPHFAYRRDGDVHVVSYEETTYRGDESGTELTFAVDDTDVEPTDYVLEDGDDLSLEITTDS